jgi:hypothetical protein
LTNAFLDNALLKSPVPEDTAVTRWLKNSPVKDWGYQGDIPAKLAAKTFVQVLFNAVVPDASAAEGLAI